MIWINPTVFKDLESAKANPTHLDGYPDEVCAGGDHDITEPAYLIGVDTFCSGCARRALIDEIQNRPADEIDREPLEICRAYRCDNGCDRFACKCPCDACGFVRCQCP